MEPVKADKIEKMRKDAVAIFHAGLKAVDPGMAVQHSCRLNGRHLLIGRKTYDLSCFKRIRVVGAGKAGASMAFAVEQLLGSYLDGGLVNVKYKHLRRLKKVRLIEAGHPVPDQNGLDGTGAIAEMISSADENDLIIALISGGGSALLPLPASGISLSDKQQAIEALLSCGANIREINVIRKHISAIKGGHMARLAYPATLAALILSDVVGDDPGVIASGPCVPDRSTFHDCMAIIDHYDLKNRLPEAVLSHIRRGRAGDLPETPKPGEICFAKTENVIIGSNISALSAAQRQAENLGYRTILLSSRFEGDTSESAKFHSAIAAEILMTGNPVQPPACLLSGGETTVKIVGNGLGGRNQEFVLVCANEIQRQEDIVVLSAGTDGTDGPTEAAGAIADHQTVARALALGVDPLEYLRRNDSYHFFKRLDDLLVTGPTLTNVMDLRVILVRRI